MSETYEDILTITRSLSAKLYFNWLIKENLLDPFKRPETIPAVFYHRRWISKYEHIVEKIFEFLGNFDIFINAGGTFTLNENYERLISKFDYIEFSDYQTHPTYLFINYGLRLLEAKLEGDTGFWDLDQFQFLFELGLTQPSYQLLSRFIEDIIDQDLISSYKKPIKFCLIGNYLESYIPTVANYISDNAIFTIITPNSEFKELTTTYCELDQETSKYSNRIFTEKEYINSAQNKADVILYVNGLGFYNSFKNQIEFLRNISKPGTSLYIVSPSTPKTQIGIEPLFYTHPKYHDIPDDLGFKKQVKIRDFNEPKRIGPFKDWDPIFETRRI